MLYKTNVYAENAVSVVETDNYPSLRYPYTENAMHNNCATMRFWHYNTSIAMNLNMGKYQNSIN